MYADKHNPKQTCTMLRSKTIFISHGSKPGILSNTLSNYATILVPKEKKKKKNPCTTQIYNPTICTKCSSFIINRIIHIRHKRRRRDIEIDLVMPTVTTEKATTPLLGFT